MTNLQHTPGPWHVLAQNVGHFRIDANRYAEPFTETEICIGVCNEANARLIAAAPELLAALQSIESLSRSPNDFLSHPVLVNVLAEINLKSTRAIFNATHTEHQPSAYDLRRFDERDARSGNKETSV